MDGRLGALFQAPIRSQGHPPVIKADGNMAELMLGPFQNCNASMKSGCVHEQHSYKDLYSSHMC